MSDIISKYIDVSKISIINIVDILEDNIEFLDNNLWSSKDEFKDIVSNVINIYYDNYYLYPENNFEKINNYISFNNKINRKLKTILLAIIDYYESKDLSKVLLEKEGSILYLTILVYLSLILYNTNFNYIESPKGIEKVINNVIDNFAKIRFKKSKDLVSIISVIKKYVIKNNDFRYNIDSLVSRGSHNSYINLNSNTNYYKVLYEYDIDALDDYDGKDIRIVMNELNILNKFMIMSFELCYYTSFKLMEKGIDYKLLIPLSMNNINDNVIDSVIKDRNNKVLSNIMFVLDYREIEGNYDIVNNLKNKDISLAIEVNVNFESSNYNMFLNVNNIIVEEEFLTLNDKYIEIWKDMEMNFIVKNMGEKNSEKDLLSNK